ncbi:hypothetical protein [Parathalassolituus penaei]|uniref:Uncharacterized protein n=1 Tax=Parathalassolituus penaei TaxID=2997323 RepID=A0A9X3ISY9_9GAMM|nr:hypothetical protein [Parathalassolituus penaei]MCY0966922.1 hypothetical protein [Parathalassolituus penaei]
MFAGMVIKGLMAFIDKKLGDAGKVLDLQLDKDKRSMRMTLQLHGEAEALEVALLDYSLEQEGNVTRLNFGRVELSRPWMQSLLNHYLPKPGVVVPEKYASMLGMLL